jgi:hypothetical protein
MIKQFVEIYMNNKIVLEEQFKQKHPDDYTEIVEMVFKLIYDNYEKHEWRSDWESFKPDYTRIHVIDDGDYQGTLLYLVPFDMYQPDCYYYVLVEYGSCSGCDTLEAIRTYDDQLPDEEQVKDYMTLALHIIQGIKIMGED